MSNENLTEQTLADVQAGIPARDAEITALRKENAELREQLEAIGAGGVNGKVMPGAVSAEPVSYVHDVPDHCDRIMWRGTYHYLPSLKLRKYLSAEPVAVPSDDDLSMLFGMWGWSTKEGRNLRFSHFKEMVGILLGKYARIAAPVAAQAQPDWRLIQKGDQRIINGQVMTCTDPEIGRWQGSGPQQPVRGAGGLPEGWKVVPIEPTRIMTEAAKAAYMPFGDMEIALRCAIISAPTRNNDE